MSQRHYIPLTVKSYVSIQSHFQIISVPETKDGSQSFLHIAFSSTLTCSITLLISHLRAALQLPKCSLIVLDAKA